MLRDAAALRRAGRYAEAEAAYQGLLQLWPDLPDSWYNLGFVQRQLGRFDAALEAYAQALHRGAPSPEEIRLNRAAIFADHLRDDEAAERELRAALELRPDYVPALLNFGNLCEDRGQRAEAIAFYERALAADPRCWLALARLAGLRSAGDALNAAIGALEQAIVRVDVSARDKATLGFALGGALDRAGDYDRAFAAYVQANEMSRMSAAAPVAYDRAAQEQLVDDIIGAFPARRTDTSARGAAPIFICGMFRSGSTLIEQVLGGHPRVTAGGELDLIPRLTRTELSPFPAAAATRSAADFARMAEDYLRAVKKIHPGADVVTDKRPDNFLYLGLIKAMFPEAKIIHTTREPLDNCLSVYFLDLDHSMAYALDLMDVGHHFRQYRRLMAHWKALFGEDIHDFDYDAFVRAPRPALQRLLEFCGLDWSEDCLAFHQRKGAVKTASVWQVREPLYQRSSGRWRRYERQLAPLRDSLRDLGAGADAPEASDA
jgi:tetratricopeptide (TPR) repeat protein